MYSTTVFDTNKWKWKGGRLIVKCSISGRFLTSKKGGRLILKCSISGRFLTSKKGGWLICESTYTRVYTVCEMKYAVLRLYWLWCWLRCEMKYAVLRLCWFCCWLRAALRNWRKRPKDRPTTHHKYAVSWAIKTLPFKSACYLQILNLSMVLAVSTRPPKVNTVHV